ncbi:SAM-dependent methyltransferase [Streptomyces sp. RB6PN25]|uniref:S-adenosyl-L-methionine-dependent methyltransferase n=1 Tax=Streptomyces humicola TaxID=2953240 RepID=A0ABT1Q4Y6_9ACTN|nr:SAM-dependent methyltransferase [Streptomyces humicola]MCQ4084976.1 SAM-dependent methyltransferase [Streptomyces humicola]
MPGVRIPEGVGRTAIFISWTRLQESRRPDALFNDPFAEVALTRLADSPEMAQLAGSIDAVEDALLADWRAGDTFAYFAVRTRYFDDRLLAAVRGKGIRQVVVLAAGLDSRALRLDWPAGTRWYELDLPDMIAFKEELLDGSGLAPRCERQAVTADLGADWAPHLLGAGFDPGAPTAWLIEGLLPYLPSEAVDALLTTVTELSAPGSELLLEHNNTVMMGEAGRSAREAVEANGAAWLSARDDLEPWLAGFGWRAEVYAGSDPSIGHGRKVPELPSTWLAHAVRG